MGEGNNADRISGIVTSYICLGKTARSPSMNMKHKDPFHDSTSFDRPTLYISLVLALTLLEDRHFKALLYFICWYCS